MVNLVDGLIQDPEGWAHSLQYRAEKTFFFPPRESRGIPGRLIPEIEVFQYTIDPFGDLAPGETHGFEGKRDLRVDPGCEQLLVGVLENHTHPVHKVLGSFFLHIHVTKHDLPRYL